MVLPTSNYAPQGFGGCVADNQRCGTAVGLIGAGSAVEVVFAARVLTDVVVDLRWVINTMTVDHGGNVFWRQGRFVLGHTSFFPLIFRGG